MSCTHVLGRILGAACPLCTGALTADPPSAKVVEVSPLRGEAAPDDKSPGVGVGNHIRLDLGNATLGPTSLPYVEPFPSDWADDWADGAAPDTASDQLFDDVPIDADTAVALLRDLDADACRGSLSEFVKLAFAIVRPGVELEWGPHVQAICDHVQWQLEDREKVVRDRTKRRRLKCQNLLINVPPRSLKTIILTLATVWAWLRWPSLKIMYLSANPRVASASARMARDLMRSQWFRETFQTRWHADERDEEMRPVDASAWDAANPVEAAAWDQPELWDVRGDQDALQNLGNTAGGARVSRGLSSTITGEGADWLIIDDPHDARDGTDKVAKAVEDYDGAVHDRANDPRCSIRTCIMQRVRSNDLSARWLETLAATGTLVHVRLPMEYETPERAECKCGTCTVRNVFGFLDWRTVEGAVIHPRFTADYITAAKKRMGARAAGQLQQRPIEAGGYIFKVGYWNWYSLTDASIKARPTNARQDPPFVLGRRRDGSLDLDWVDISVDCSNGSTSDDASALGYGAIGGKGERRFLLRDFTDGPATWLQTMDRLLAAVRLTARIAGKQPRFSILIEKKALGSAAAEQLQKHILDGDLRYPDGTAIRARVELYEPTGKGSKEDRADTMEPDVAAGFFHLLDGDDANTTPYREEVEGFPKADRDDRVDYTAQCLDHHRNAEDDWVTHFKRKRQAEAERRAATSALPRVADREHDQHHG